MMVKKGSKKYKSWIFRAIIAFVLSLIINFSATSFKAFLVNSLIFGVVLMGVLILITKSIKEIKEKNIRKAILFGVLSIIAIFVFFCGIFFSYPLCSDILILHFRTNILTGQCNLGYPRSCFSDPWYYKSDCNISMEKKREIILASNNNLVGDIIWLCNSSCEQDVESYCSINSGIQGISCNDLVKCASISC